MGEFHRDRDGYQPWCKACRKEYDHDYYLATKTRWADNKRAWKAARRQWLRDLKTGKPCFDCSGIFPPEAMHWDHRPGTVKLGEVSTLGARRSIAEVEAEIAKCDLVCANDHAIRTYKRMRERIGLDVSEELLAYCA